MIKVFQKMKIINNNLSKHSDDNGQLSLPGWQLTVESEPKKWNEIIKDWKCFLMLLAL